MGGRLGRRDRGHVTLGPVGVRVLACGGQHPVGTDLAQRQRRMGAVPDHGPRRGHERRGHGVRPVRRSMGDGHRGLRRRHLGPLPAVRIDLGAGQRTRRPGLPRGVRNRRLPGGRRRLAGPAVVGGEPVLVGECNSENVVLKRQGDTWKRIDRGLPTDMRWDNAAVVDKQLWVQGTRIPGDRAVSIYRRANGAWLPVSTDGIPASADRGLRHGGNDRPERLAGRRDRACRWPRRPRGLALARLRLEAGRDSRDGERTVLDAVDAKGFKPAWIVGDQDLGEPEQSGAGAAREVRRTARE